MKRLPILALLLLAPLANAQQVEPPATATTGSATALESISDPELRQILSQAIRTMTSMMAILESVHDKATADAAAPKLKVRMALTEEQELALEYIPYPVVMQAMYEAGITPEQTEALEKRLKDNSMYGSTALAEALGLPDYTAMKLCDFTEEEQKELSRLLTEAATQIEGLSGGPGLSKETAWQFIPIHEDSPARLAAALGQVEDQGHHFTYDIDGQLYQQYDYLLTRNGNRYLIQLWFKRQAPSANTEEVATAPDDWQQDITPDAPEDEIYDEPMEISVEPGGHYTDEPEPTITPEQQATALNNFVTQMNELVALLQTISDSSSADAAAPQAELIRSRIEPLSEVLETIPAMDIIEALEAADTATPGEISTQKTRLEEAGFYQSEALRKALTH
ncbi:MAG: hypothetical protein IKZ13_03245 [Akkermansia sp.]|nr:hypothetical protein [Akkermansia sp.]